VFWETPAGEECQNIADVGPDAVTG